MTIAVINEKKTPPDKRVVLSPNACKNLLKKYPKLKIKIEPSDIRVFTNQEYRDVGIPVTDNLSDCEVFLGVKEVPISELVPNKKYFFFSHTIKKQPYNRDLLRAILEKNIILYDHETIVNKNEHRLIGFGRYAGIVGAYNGIRAFGLKFSLFELPKAEQLKDKNDLIQHLQKISLPKIKIVLTGKGRVGRGANEILSAMGIKKVTAKDFLSNNYKQPVYTQLEVMDYNQRKDGKRGSKQDFFDHPDEYKSTFMRFSKEADVFIAGHYWDENAPYLFTREDAKHPDFNLSVVADISCDIDGPVATTIRPSTIDSPIYGYNPETETETDFTAENAIAVMAVDNLPCELPRDASVGFGKAFTEHVIGAFFNGDKDGILQRAKITENGKLTPRFSYLQNYVDGKE
ncbi:MAG: alanine dehydrogenase [Flavobacteriales bacterium]|nr:MAG: alanine dehydrogenase [Flavobacteriales bacterium]